MDGWSSKNKWSKFFEILIIINAMFVNKVVEDEF